MHPLIFHTKLFALYKYYNTQYGAVAAGNYSLSKGLEFSNFERTLDLLQEKDVNLDILFSRQNKFFHRGRKVLPVD